MVGDVHLEEWMVPFYRYSHGCAGIVVFGSFGLTEYLFIISFMIVVNGRAQKT